MRAITLFQPWASLIADGHKTIETRTHDRFKCLKGETIAIHAGQNYDYGCWCDAQGEEGLSFITKEKYGEDVVRGAVICTVYVADAKWLTTKEEYLAACMSPSDFGLERRFGLFLERPRKFEPPIKVKGMQGIWPVVVPSILVKCHRCGAERYVESESAAVNEGWSFVWGSESIFCPECAPLVMPERFAEMNRRKAEVMCKKGLR